MEGDISERTICSLALVKVSFDRRRSFLSYFEPFLEDRMLKAEPSVVSIPALQVDIEGKFGLWLPQAVIKTLLRRQEAAGHVSVERDICRINRTALAHADLAAEQQQAMREQGALIETLVEYAQAKFKQNWIKNRAQKLLLAYVETFSAKLLQATVAGKEFPAIDREWKTDQYIVHSFVLHAIRENPSSFRFLTSLVKGKMLSDAIYLSEPEIQEGIEPLSKVEVYFDTPILLRMLGYEGEDMAAPYLELLEMLHRQEALVRCFSRNVEEAEAVLLRAAGDLESKESADHAQRDVASHLARSGATPSDVVLMARQLPSKLREKEIKIQLVDLSPPDGRQQKEVELLSEMLRRGFSKYKERALINDAEALVAVHKLRRGDAPRTLHKCKAVFVTRNYRLFKIANEYFQQRDPGPSIPTCIPMSAFTTMVWVREPLSAPDLPEDQVIADALAAMSPGPELWKAFNDEVEQLERAENISPEDAHHLRIDYESRRALMDETKGGRDAYVEGTAEQVLERNRENTFVAAHGRRTSIERVGLQASRWITRVIYALVVPLLALGIVFGPLGIASNSPSPVPPVLQWLGTLLFFCLSAWGLVTGISLKSAAGRTAEFLERYFVRVGLRVLGEQPQS